MFLLWIAIFCGGILIYCKLVKLSFGICKCSRNQVGKVTIVTGSNTGCGYETAKDFADRGAKVILACRSERRGIKARDEIIQATGNKDVYFYKLDLSSLKSVRDFVNEFTKNEKRLDILVNNAGDLVLDVTPTEDGLLLGMQVNYFGPFLLTNLLLPILKASKPSRIVNVASMFHKYGKVDLKNLNKGIDSYKGKIQIYANAKLCTVLSTIELSRQLEGSGVTVNTLCPGFVRTNIFDKIKSPVLKALLLTRAYMYRKMAKDAWEGAQTQIYLSVSPEVKDISGCYFQDCEKSNLDSFAKDPFIAKKLWEVSEAIVKLHKKN